MIQIVTAVLSNALPDRGTGVSGDIECTINGEYSIGCRREDGEVFVPFSFLHKYYEVRQNGKKFFTFKLMGIGTWSKGDVLLLTLK